MFDLQLGVDVMSDAKSLAVNPELTKQKKNTFQLNHIYISKLKRMPS